MRAWIMEHKNGVDALKLMQVPDPDISPDEVLVKVSFASLNPADYYLAEDQYPAHPPLPHVLGREGTGEILKVGANVTTFKAGDEVMILRGETGVTRWGTFAELVAVHAERISRVPQGWTSEQAAGASLVYLTAYQALTQWGDLEPAMVLVSGASGGVGIASIQLAAALGHRVIGLSRSAGKSEALQKLGAAAIFNPADPNWPAKVKELTGEARVGLAIDSVGGEEFNQILKVMGDHGKISVVGQLAGAVPQFKTASLYFRRLRIGGVFVGSYDDAQARQAWKKVVDLLQSNHQHPVVDSIWPLDQLKEAFGKLKRGPLGKVLLDVGS